MNTGRKVYRKLREYYRDINGNKVYTGNTKDNEVSDLDYIPPDENSTDCPIGPSRPTIWIPEEESSYCEDGNTRPMIWIGMETTAYCEVVEDTELPSPTTLNIVEIQIQNTSSLGANDGVITAIVEGGSLPYMYSINDGIDWQYSNIFGNLSRGNYYLLVKDFSENSKVKQFYIN